MGSDVDLCGELVSWFAERTDEILREVRLTDKRLNELKIAGATT